MGVFGFVAAGGGSIGVLLGGFLTGAFDWHWIFLVNVPIGVIVCALSLASLPATSHKVTDVHLDVAGAVAVTLSLMLLVYAIVNGNQTGWASLETMSLLVTAVALAVGFLAIEARVKAPLVPLRLFRRCSLAVANIIGIFWAAAIFAWFFLSALYLQLVLSYSPLQVGLAFLPANLIMAAFSLGLSARVVLRFGVRKPLTIGLLIAAAGLGLLARAPIEAAFATNIMPSMVLLGIGGGRIQPDASFGDERCGT
jgi:hypothetical protein